MKKGIIAILASIILVISAFFVIPAGAFDGNDYDYGGGGDSWSYSSDDSDYYGSDSLSGGQMVFFVIFVIVIVIIAYSKSGSKSNNSSSSSGGTLPNRTPQIEEIIKKHDPDFSASEFTEYTKQLYVDMQLAWCARDLESLRPILHENLYNTTANQIKQKIAQGVVYHYESIVVDTAYLNSYTRDDKFEYLSLYVSARMIDWQEDEKTGRILRGDKTTRWTLKYKMKFMRPLDDAKTLTTDSPKCPSCGAPLEIGSTSKCEYCGSVVRTSKHTWILSEFATLRNDTIDEGIKE